MQYSTLNQAANTSFIRFKEYLKHPSNGSGSTLFFINECPYDVYIAVGTTNFSEITGDNDQNIALTFLKEFLEKPNDFHFHITLPNHLFDINDDAISKKVSYPLKSQKLEIRRVSETKFVFLISGEDENGIPLVGLRIVSNIWHLDQERVPLHAAGILHKGGLYLFSGPSGAGKSTISILSLTIGDKLVDEDQLLIYKNKLGNDYSAIAWGTGSGKSQAPIRGFFWLVKSNVDKLLPLSTKQAGKRIWEQSLQAIGGILPMVNRNSLFMRVSEFARTTPSYELHFRKSPDFWNLIDAQIPTD